MTTPVANIDNTTLLALTGNLDIGDVADPALRLVYFQYLNVYIQTITSAFNSFVANGAVGSVNLADLSVLTAKIADLAVTTGKIAELAVTTAKLNDMSVTLAKMAAASVGTTQLVDLSVTNDKIANGVITADKFVPGVLNNETQNGLLIAALLVDNAISPDAFAGNDLVRVQAAFDAALAQGRSVRLGKMYNITSLGSIKINKTTSLDRTPIYVFGQGGGIKKTDAGNMFTSDTTDVGDLTFISVKFESVKDAGTVVFDCNKLIRINSQNCAYRYVDKIVYAGDTRQYIQSMRFMGDTIVGGGGYAFDFIGAYDFSLDNVLIEARESGVRQRYSATGTNSLYNCRIRDSIFEGLSGTALSLANVDSLTIDGCYFELNVGGHVVFHASAVMFTVNISNCRVFIGGLDTNSFIKWGAQPKNCTSFNNIAYNTSVHNTTSVSVSHFIISKNDISGNSAANVIGAFDPIIFYTSNYSKLFSTLGSGDKITRFGNFNRLHQSSTANITFTAGEMKVVVVQFSESIPKDSIIDPKAYVSSNKFVNICYCQRDASDNTKVNVYMQNVESTSITVQTVEVTVIKPFYTLTG